MYAGSLFELAVVQFLMVASVKSHENSHNNLDNRLTTVKIHHSIGSYNDYKLRGTIILPNSRDKETTLKQEPLTGEDIALLKKAASTNGLYYLKAIAYKNSEEETKVATSFNTACSLVESKLSDILTLSLDYSGNLIGVSDTSLNPSCSNLKDNLELTSFNTTVRITQAAAGPVPDTQTYVQRMEQEKHEKMKGDKADNRSFFAKYWMYIVPLVVFVLISSTANPEAQ